MPDPAWPSSPPEVNYLRLVGPGAAGTATTIASGAAWQVLAIGGEVASTASTLNTAQTAPSFEGVGGSSSAAAATGLNTSLQLLAGWAQEKPVIAANAVAAYETAVSSMIPAEVSIANRTEQAADVALNPLVLGALTPAIVALDAEYFGEHWPHNAGVGIVYGATLSALIAALAVPPPLSPIGGSPAGPVGAAAAIAEAAGQAAAGEALEGSAPAAHVAASAAAAPAEAGGRLGQFAAMAAQPMQAAAGMFQVPKEAFRGMAAMPQSMAGALGAALPMIDDSELPPGLLAGTGAVGAAGSVSSGAAPQAGAGLGALPGAGLTAYNRPAGSPNSETAGRPAALKTALLNTALLHEPTTSGAGSVIPVPPGRAGTPGQPNSADDRTGASPARIVVGKGV